MDSAQVWETIRDVVGSGVEDDEVELKSVQYKLDEKPEKARFLKDVLAMANSLSDHGDMRYIVCGVLDRKQCEDRSQASSYMRGVQPGDVNEINETVSTVISEYADPAIDVRYLEMQHPEVDKTLGIVEVRGWLGGWDERPYVLAKGIHKHRRSQIFVRRVGGVSQPAGWTDIRLLVNHAQEQRIKSLEEELADLRKAKKKSEAQLEKVRRESEEMLRQDAAEKLQERTAKLQEEHQEIEEELNDEIKGLKSDKARLAEEGERWRELARAMCRRFHWRLDDAESGKLRRLMAHHHREEEFDSWVSS